MFNPFYPFTQQLLNGFIKAGKTFFVRQTFERGRDPLLDEGIKGCFLFSHYDNLTTAQDHFGAIGRDRNRFLYDWMYPEHQEKLKVAAGGLSEYKIFSAVLKPDWEKGITPRLKEKIKAHVSRLGWSPKGGDTVDSNYELKFGELFIRLKWKGRVAEVKMDDIEKNV